MVSTDNDDFFAAGEGGQAPPARHPHDHRSRLPAATAATAAEATRAAEAALHHRPRAFAAAAPEAAAAVPAGPRAHSVHLRYPIQLITSAMVNKVGLGIKL